MQTIQLLGTVLGLGFVSGINLYATVLAVGLAIDFDFVHLSPELAGLAVLGHPLVLAVAALMYTAEFFADKIPWVDSLWDALHTFVRPLGAAAITAAALGVTDPAFDLAAFLLAGGVAFSTHAAKSGIRLVANGSPEPFSNVLLSVAEDAVAIGGAWVALNHPLTAGLIAVVFTAGFLWVAPRLVRILRAHVRAVGALFRVWFGRVRAPEEDLVEDLPNRFAQELPVGFGGPGDLAVRCFAGRGVGAPRSQVGYLCLVGDGAPVWLGRKRFRVKSYPIDLARVTAIGVRHGVLFDELSFRSGARAIEFLFTRDRRDALDALAQRLGAGRAAAPTAA